MKTDDIDKLIHDKLLKNISVFLETGGVLIKCLPSEKFVKKNQISPQPAIKIPGHVYVLILELFIMEKYYQLIRKLYLQNTFIFHTRKILMERCQHNPHLIMLSSIYRKS